MTKKEWVQVGIFFLLVLLFAGIFGGGVIKIPTDMERELKDAEKKGYTVTISRKYTADDMEEYSSMTIYSENREIKSSHYDKWGDEQFYFVPEYNSNGLKQKSNRYNKKNGDKGYSFYVYDKNNNLTEEHLDKGQHIYYYSYDEKNRKIAKKEKYGEGICPEVLYSNYYFYDEENRLSREEIFANDKPYAYIVYEYNGMVLLREEEYRTSQKEYSFHDGTEYIYDEEGRLIKSIYYGAGHKSYGYMSYEYY